MSSFDEFRLEEDDPILTNHLNQLHHDHPRIDASLKNLISILSVTKLKNLPDTIPYSILLELAKLFLLCLQQIELPSLNIFCNQVQQTEEQTASERLDQIARYKVIVAYHRYIIAKSQKVSKSFGKLLLLNTSIWNSIKENFLERIKSNPKLTENEGMVLIEYYEESIFKTLESEGSRDSDLIWSTDFSKSLKARQEQRDKEVQLRLTALKVSSEDEQVETAELQSSYLELSHVVKDIINNSEEK